MASGHRHWKVRLDQAVATPAVTRRARRQLRKLSGRHQGQEWRLFGLQVRTWARKAHGWSRIDREDSTPHDALNRLIVARIRAVGHVLQEQK